LYLRVMHPWAVRTVLLKAKEEVEDGREHLRQNVVYIPHYKHHRERI